MNPDMMKAAALSKNGIDDADTNERALLGICSSAISSTRFGCLQRWLKNGSTILDCLWGELYGSINAAEIDDGAITPAQADYLRKKYLWR